jgi:tripartite-type tricarboxylate transporter receptor subunit TctC
MSTLPSSPFRGPARRSILGDHVNAYFGNYSDAAPHLIAGKLRALAVATPVRSELLPDVPTVAESGYAGYELDGWFGLFAPAKTPKSIIVHLAEQFASATNKVAVKGRLVALGLYPSTMCGDEFTALIRMEYDAYGRIIRDAAISGR